MFSDEKKHFRIGCAVIVIFLALILGYLMLEQYNLIQERHVVLATFDTIPPVEENSNVHMAGIVIGVVDSIGFTEGAGTVTVRMEIDKEAYKRIGIDSEAIALIDMQSGNNRISITPSQKVDLTTLDPVKHVKGRVVGPESLENVKELLEKLTDEKFIEQIVTLIMKLDDISGKSIPERTEVLEKRIEELETRLKKLEEQADRK